MSKFEVKDDANKVTITLDGNTGDISVGGEGQDGKIIIKDKLGNALAEMRGWQIIFFSPDGKQTASLLNTADFVIGGHGKGGDIHLVPPSANGLAVALEATISLDGDTGNIVLKTGGTPTIRLDGAKADLYLGGANQDGSLTLRNDAGHNTIYLDGAKADLFLGGANQDGRVVVRNATGKDTVTLDGKAGDISLANEDCAEDFDVSQSAEVEPGTVVVIDQDGQLQPSRDPYDKKVAGVISGAGNCRPGLVLGKKSWHPDRLPVALVGKVYCKVDAQYSAIEIGDLLTTSPTPGHAMKADDPLKAFGAVIGKALCALKAGQDLIPILVALQ
jgi:hypothetical protein